MSWENSGRSGDIDIAYGIEANARPTSDLASLPRKLWGSARTDVSGWGVSARADLNPQDWSSADLEINADNEENDLSLNLVASAGNEFSVRRVEATKGVDANGGRVTVTPRYNLENDERDVVLNYSNDKTEMKLTASADNQELTISQRLDDDNRIAPTINNRGDLSLEWERRLSDDSSLTATLRPNESLDVEWKDDAWTANVNMPISGSNINGANVSIKRDVQF